MSKIKLVVCITMGLLFIGLVAIADTINLQEGISENAYFSTQGDLDFASGSNIHVAGYSGEVISDGILAWDLHLNHDVTVDIDAEPFTHTSDSSKTLETKFAAVGVGAGPAWYDAYDASTGTPQKIKDCSGSCSTYMPWAGGWNNTNLDWKKASTVDSYSITFDRSNYPSGKIHGNVRVQVTRNGYQDIAGTYEASISATIS